MSGWNLPPGVSQNDPHINPPDEGEPAPACVVCDSAASYVAAQSTDQGETVTWVLICQDHRDGWNEGGDWTAPVYRLGDRDLDL